MGLVKAYILNTTGVYLIVLKSDFWRVETIREEKSLDCIYVGIFTKSLLNFAKKEKMATSDH